MQRRDNVCNDFLGALRVGRHEHTSVAAAYEAAPPSALPPSMRGGCEGGCREREGRGVNSAREVLCRHENKSRERARVVIGASQ